MIIYEVNLKVDRSIYAEYVAWLKEHITEMIANPWFVEHRIYIATQDSEQQELVVHYVVASHADLQSYFETSAPAMRSKAVARFGDRFSATRRVLEGLQL